MRYILGSLLIAALALGLLGCTGDGAGLVAISNVVILPNGLPAAGGQVTISGMVAGATSPSVWVEITAPDLTVETLTLTDSGGGLYITTWHAPANTSATSEVYHAVLYAASGFGAPAQSSPRNITVAGTGGGGPPPGPF